MLSKYSAKNRFHAMYAHKLPGRGTAPGLALRV